MFSPVTLWGVVLNILCSQSFDLELVQICTCGNTNIIININFCMKHSPKNIYSVCLLFLQNQNESFFFFFFCLNVSIAVLTCFVLQCLHYKSLTVADGGHFLLGRGGSVVHPPRCVNAPTEPGRQGTRV